MTHGPLSQRSFLLHMGIGTRLAALRRAASSPEHEVALDKAAARLVDGAGMGREYKVMGVTGGIGREQEKCGRLSRERHRTPLRRRAYIVRYQLPEGAHAQARCIRL